LKRREAPVPDRVRAKGGGKKKEDRANIARLELRKGGTA